MKIFLSSSSLASVDIPPHGGKLPPLRTMVTFYEIKKGTARKLVKLYLNRKKKKDK